MSILSTAIIGCGVIGRTHVEAVLQLVDSLALTALVDVDRARADALADVVEESIGSRPAVYSTVQELVAADAPQLVVVATPSGLHVEQAVVALEAGAHVLIEKPLDVDLVRARRLADAAAAAASRGQVCSVISQHRFDPSSQIVRAAIADGGFGRLTSGLATVPWWRSQEYYDSGDWRGTWALDGGGALMNQGVHTVDLLVWFLGRPVTVSAEIALLAHEGVEVEDTAVATLTFDGGALAVLHATTAGYPGLSVRLQLLGSDGSAVIEGDALRYIHLKKDAEGAAGAYGGGENQAERYSVEQPTGVDATQFSFGHVRQYLDLLDAIADGREPLLTVEQALLALAAVRAVYISAVLGRKVLIDDVISGEYDDLILEVPAIEIPAR
ncbi:Gfo/Idh/MocA family protein [Microbacterium sp. GXF0217]